MIVGTVTDRSGAAIVEATVTIRDTGTNATVVVKTNASGFYTSPALQIGTYDVTATRPGFETVNEPNVVVDVGTRAQIDFPMRPGSITTEVTVEAVSPALNTTSGTLGYVVDQRTIEDLPLNGGNALALAALLPGVVNSFGANPSGFSERGAILSSIRVGGGAVGAYANTLDGANNQITYLGEVAINPQADSIAQFRLYSGTTPAQYGFTSGGAIDIATRAGTNRFHGTVYEFLRNDAADAQNFFSSPLIHKPELRYNRFGGSLSGPIRRNKMFFFGNAEHYELVTTGPTYLTVPTELERKGDFSQTGISITPTATYKNGCQPVSIIDPTTNIPFPGNVINRPLDPAAVAIQNAFYPLPNNSTGLFVPCSHTNNYVSSAKSHTHQQLIVGRIDYQANSHNGFLLRYGNYHFGNSGNSQLPDYNATGRTDDAMNQGATFGYTRVLTPRIVNDLRVSGLRSKFTFLAGSHDQNLAAQYGISNVPALTLPILNNGVATFTAIYGYRSATQFQIVDTLSEQAGNQTLIYGVDLRFNQAENNQNNAGSGTFNFFQITTGNNSVICPSVNGSPAATCTGSMYASYLLGVVGSANLIVVSPATYRSSSISGFVQDDWKITRNFTVNLGLRYDYQQQPFELRNRISNFDPTRTDPANGLAGAVVYAGAGGYGNTFNRENYTDISPRLGFALVLPNSYNTILRGGYSVYYSSTANISFTNNPTTSTTTNYSATTNNGVALLLSGGFPTPALIPNTPASRTPNFGLGAGNVQLNEANQRTPLAQVFTLGLSKEFPSKFVVDISYLGNNGAHFVQPNYNLNQLDPKFFYLGNQNGVDGLQATTANPYFGLVPSSSGLNGASLITYNQLYKPYPYYTGVVDFQPRNGRYFGNYMYVSLQRRVANGTQIIGSYTLGKLLSDPIYVPLAMSGGISTGFNSTFQNTRDRSAEHTIDALDVTHRFNLSVIARLPFGSGQKFLHEHSFGSRVLSNISLNGIATVQGGTPLAIAGATNYTATRPNFSGIDPGTDCNTNQGSFHSHTYQCWFNPAAFVNPPNYTFGNVPRTLSYLRGPGAVNIDASIFKTIQFKDRFGIQLRLEGFNVLNHANFNNPNTTLTATQNNIANTNTSNTNANFGRITSAAASRSLQAGVKVTF